MACSSCLREKKIVARDLCGACYGRWWKKGTTAYEPPRVRSKCSVKDCGGDVVSHGLCDKHRLRLRDHGHLEETRPDSWGAIERHPLMHAWRWMNRHRGINGKDICPEWSDFLQFAIDVGERPSKKHRFLRIDDSRPYGPGNFQWKEVLQAKRKSETAKDYARRYQRNYRKIAWRATKSADLKKSYGISIDDYEEMFEMQDGKCAICKQKETLAIRGKKLTLCVDHCHKTGQIRALLCSQCNTGLGCFKDDPKLLRAAAAYVAA